MGRGQWYWVANHWGQQENYELHHGITYSIYANGKGSHEPAHLRSLAGLYAVHSYKP